MDKPSMKKLCSEKEKFAAIVDAYLENPDEYVQKFSVTINGKLRHIITYTSGENGKALRYFHHTVAEALAGTYTSSYRSFAYKKNTGVLPCIEEHLENRNFLKADIHAYFDSINYEILMEKLLQLSGCKRYADKLPRIIKACFHEDKLPIGFITSPVLSDIYLTSVDRKFARVKAFTYSRYADDFIISSNKDIKVLEEVRTELENELAPLQLELNHAKTYFRTLCNIGDSIHVLGANIVKTETGTNRVTISDRYLRQVSKDFATWSAHAENEETCDTAKAELYQVAGKISFVRQFSEDSYQKLRKMILIKTGKDISEI